MKPADEIRVRINILIENITLHNIILRNNTYAVTSVVTGFFWVRLDPPVICSFPVICLSNLQLSLFVCVILEFYHIILYILHIVLYYTLFLQLHN